MKTSLTTLDIQKLIAIPSNSYEKWNILLSKESKEALFLKPFLPLLEHAYQIITQSIKKHSAQTHQLLSDENLCKQIFSDLAPALLTLIIRVCVLEMHDAKIRGFLTATSSETRFEQFVELLAQTENSIALLKKYPVMADKIALIVNQYMIASCEFFIRLEENFEDIKREFLKEGSNYKIKNIRRTGDMHRDGHTVMLVNFLVDDEKITVVYKPRNMSIDIAFEKFLGWFNAQSTLNLYTPKCLSYDNYGWNEFIKQTPCQDQAAAQRYYQRLGMQLAITYLLNGEDVHMENVIAHGEYPVVIDLECLILPVTRLPMSETFQSLRHNVLNTFILPQMTLVAGKGKKGIDLSSFSGTPDQTYPQPQLITTNPGTDEMLIVRKDVALEGQQNNPQLNGKNINAYDYQADFISGFIQTYQIFIKHSDYLQSEQSILKYFEKVETRILRRHSAQYAKLILESYHPRLLYDKNAYQEHFNWLYDDALIDKKYKYIIDAFANTERDELMAINIPIFLHRTDQPIIHSGSGQTISGFVLQSGYPRLMAHIKNHINTSDLAVQLQIIKQCLIAQEYNLQLNQSESDRFKLVDVQSTNDRVQDFNKIFKRHTEALLDQLLSTIADERPIPTWSSLEITPSKVWIPSRTQIDLYSGLTGIILCFAYGAEILSKPHYKSFALRALEQLRCYVTEIPKHTITLGTYSQGLGALLYCFFCLYRLWGNASLKDDIKNILALFPEEIKRDHEIDIIDGCAGYLAALNTCTSVIDNNIYQKQASACIDFILQKYPTPENPTEASQKQMNFGFAHGTTGISWAMAKHDLLTKTTKNQDWLKASYAYERQYYSKKNGNWPGLVLDDKGNQIFVYDTVAWCYGATGTGLARLDLYRAGVSDPLVESEIKQAITTTLEKGFGNTLNLCHGNFGNLEFLWQAQATGFLSEKKFYQYIASTLAGITDITNIKTLEIGSVFIPGLMTGVAGIAYQMMRFINPQLVPSVLLLDNVN